MRSWLSILICFVASRLIGGAPVLTVAYPLKTSAGLHYPIDQNGNPFFVNGDSPWFLHELLSPTDVDYYLSNRWIQGYNSIVLDMAAEIGQDPTNDDFFGRLPFTNTIAGPYTNLASWNLNYFTNLDAVIQRAGYYGINVFGYPLYSGFNGAGWYHEMAGNSSNTLWSYGQFIGTHYKGFTNLVYFGAGDYTEPNSPSNNLWNIVAAGIRSADTNHLFTAHAARPTPAIWYTNFVTLNADYPSQFTYVQGIANYQTVPILASFDQEPYYEHRSGIASYTFGALDCRMFFWWSVLSGDAGSFYGDENQWPFTTGWQTEMWDAGATTITNCYALLRNRRWWNLVPDTNHTVITSGYGTSGQTNYVTCARDVNGSSILAYTSGGSPTLTVDMSKISSPVSRSLVNWYNPRTGSTTTVGSFATSGTQNFTPSDGNDWVLTLDAIGTANAIGLSGSIITTGGLSF